MPRIQEESIVPRIRQHCETLGGAVALRFLIEGEVDGPSDELTFDQFGMRVRAVAAVLEREGLSGKRALLLYLPGLDFVVAFVACLEAGVIAVPAYPPDPSRIERSLARLRGMVADCEPSAILTTAQLADMAAAMVESAPEIRDARWIPTDRVAASEASSYRARSLKRQDLAFLQYTSGSTARPRGVQVTHGNLLANSLAIFHLGQFSPRTVNVTWLPCYHDMGLIGGILQPLFVGFLSVLMSPMAFLKRPARWLEAVTRFRGTGSAFPNFALDLCTRKVTDDERSRLDLSTWTEVWNGAEPVRQASLERFTKRFAERGFSPRSFVPVYGLAESTLIVSGARAADSFVVRPVSRRELSQHRVVAPTNGEEQEVLVGCGLAVPGHEVRIVDPITRAPAARDRVGEIWVRGPSVATGYWGRAEDTAETFGAHLQTGEGPYLRTGDLGFLAEGELFVTGRSKDLIILRGANYYPTDIEEVVERAHAGIRAGSCAAVALGRAGTEEGEGLGILAEIKGDAPRELLLEIALRVRELLSTELALSPDKIALLAPLALPKTSSGKVQRHVCKQGLETGELRALLIDEAPVAPRPPSAVAKSKPAAVPRSTTSPASATSVTDAVRITVRDVLARSTGYPAAAFQDATRLVGYLGLDSMKLVEIISELEKELGTLGDDIFNNPNLTFDGLVRMIEQRATPDRQRAIHARHTVRETPPHDVPAPTGSSRALPALTRESSSIEEFPEVSEIRATLMLFDALDTGNPFFRTVDGPAEDTVSVAGKTLINFATYNYLGLAFDERVKRAAIAAIEQYGTSASASRLASGERPVHCDLERELAEFMGCQDAVVFASGHATNLTAIATLVGRDDLVLHDSLAHDSILAGARLSGARRMAFPHNDLDALERLLNLRGNARRVLIAVEGAYSMDGDLPPLAEIVELKKRHGALLMVDEAHSLGCVGATGRGIGEHAGVARTDVDVWMGTLSKSLASCGGYVAGSRALVDILKYKGGGFVYAAAISPSNAAAALEALRILRAEPWRVATLRDRVTFFQRLCRERHIDIGRSEGAAIVPVMVGGSVRCLQVADRLRRDGVNAPPIFYPAVEEDAARLRFFVSAKHEEAQLTAAADALVRAFAAEPAARVASPPRAVTMPPPRVEAPFRKVLVTGASGFIGSRVASRLIDAGCELRLLLRPTSKTRRLTGLSYETELGDLADKASLDRAVAGCDAVIHLACASSWTDLRAAAGSIDRVAVDGTRNVLEAAQKAGVGRFIHVSSVTAINASDTPHVFDEDSPYELADRGLEYSLAKHRAEQLVLGSARDGFDVVIVSPAEVYGPDDDDLVTAGNILEILKASPPVSCQGGTSVAHVDDVAAGIVSALVRGRSGERYILGGENLTVFDLTSLVLRLAGRRNSVVDIPNVAAAKLCRAMVAAGMTPPIAPEVLEYATLYWFVDSTKARRELAYQTRSAERTLEPVIHWLNESGRLAEQR